MYSRCHLYVSNLVSAASPIKWESFRGLQNCNPKQPFTQNCKSRGKTCKKTWKQKKRPHHPAVQQIVPSYKNHQFPHQKRWKWFQARSQTPSRRTLPCRLGEGGEVGDCGCGLSAHVNFSDDDLRRKCCNLLCYMMMSYVLIGKYPINTLFFAD